MYKVHYWKDHLNLLQATAYHSGDIDLGAKQASHPSNDWGDWYFHTAPDLV